MATYYPPEIMLLQGCPFQSSARITWQMSNKGKGPDPQGTAANSPGIAPRYMGTHCTRFFKAAEQLSHVGLQLFIHRRLV